MRKSGAKVSLVSQIRIKDAAEFLAVSDDTVRRWIEAGTLASSKDESGRTVVDGLALASLARDTSVLAADPSGIGRSARNRFVGLVTKITMDTVMAQVELQCGQHRVVSLMSSEAVRELGLEPGSVAIAVVKATSVIVETPRP
jgi:molybdopterin-binding protein